MRDNGRSGWDYGGIRIIKVSGLSLGLESMRELRERQERSGSSVIPSA